MNKRILIAILLTITTWHCQAQQESFHFDRSKITFGGNLGLGFDNNSTIINIAPQIGYYFTPQLNAGVGVSYTYYNYKNGDSEKFNYAGFNLFGRYYPIPYLVIHVQPEINYMHHSFRGEKESDIVPALIVGAGVHINSFTIMLQYDVAQHQYSPYGNNLFYSVGFSF